jgi:hypothetical protein
VLGHSKHQVGDLRGLHERRRIAQQLGDRSPARFEVALELRALRAYGVGAPQGVLALRERPRRRTYALRKTLTIVGGSDRPTLPRRTRPCAPIAQGVGAGVEQAAGGCAAGQSAGPSDRPANSNASVPAIAAHSHPTASSRHLAISTRGVSPVG